MGLFHGSTNIEATSLLEMFLSTLEFQRDGILRLLVPVISIFFVRRVIIVLYP